MEKDRARKQKLLDMESSNEKLKERVEKLTNNKLNWNGSTKSKWFSTKSTENLREQRLVQSKTMELQKSNLNTSLCQNADLNSSTVSNLGENSTNSTSPIEIISSPNDKNFKPVSPKRSFSVNVKRDLEESKKWPKVRDIVGRFDQAAAELEATGQSSSPPTLDSTLRSPVRSFSSPLNTNSTALTSTMKNPPQILISPSITSTKSESTLKSPTQTLTQDTNPTSILPLSVTSTEISNSSNYDSKSLMNKNNLHSTSFSNLLMKKSSLILKSSPPNFSFSNPMFSEKVADYDEKLFSEEDVSSIDGIEDEVSEDPDILSTSVSNSIFTSTSEDDAFEIIDVNNNVNNMDNTFTFEKENINFPEIRQKSSVSSLTELILNQEVESDVKSTTSLTSYNVNKIPIDDLSSASTNRNAPAITTALGSSEPILDAIADSTILKEKNAKLNIKTEINIERNEETSPEFVLPKRQSSLPVFNQLKSKEPVFSTHKNEPSKNSQISTNIATENKVKKSVSFSAKDEFFVINEDENTKDTVIGNENSFFTSPNNQLHSVTNNVKNIVDKKEMTDKEDLSVAQRVDIPVCSSPDSERYVEKNTASQFDEKMKNPPSININQNVTGGKDDYRRSPSPSSSFIEEIIISKVVSPDVAGVTVNLKNTASKDDVKADHVLKRPRSIIIIEERINSKIDNVTEAAEVKPVTADVDNITPASEKFMELNPKTTEMESEDNATKSIPDSENNQLNLVTESDPCDDFTTMIDSVNAAKSIQHSMETQNSSTSPKTVPLQNAESLESQEQNAAEVVSESRRISVSDAVNEINDGLELVSEVQVKRVAEVSEEPLKIVTDLVSETSVKSFPDVVSEETVKSVASVVSEEPLKSVLDVVSEGLVKSVAEDSEELLKSVAEVVSEEPVKVVADLVAEELDMNIITNSSKVKPEFVRFNVSFSPAHHNPKTTVVFTGTFDSWSQSLKLTRVHNTWVGSILLNIYKDYQYKFVVDGLWMVDTSCEMKEDDFGNVNNYISSNALKELKRIKDLTKDALQKVSQPETEVVGEEASEKDDNQHFTTEAVEVEVTKNEESSSKPTIMSQKVSQPETEVVGEEACEKDDNQHFTTEAVVVEVTKNEESSSKPITIVGSLFPTVEKNIGVLYDAIQLTPEIQTKKPPIHKPKHTVSSDALTKLKSKTLNRRSWHNEFESSGNDLAEPVIKKIGDFDEFGIQFVENNGYDSDSSDEGTTIPLPRDVKNNDVVPVEEINLSDIIGEEVRYQVASDNTSVRKLSNAGLGKKISLTDLQSTANETSQNIAKKGLLDEAGRVIYPDGYDPSRRIILKKSFSDQNGRITKRKSADLKNLKKRVSWLDQLETKESSTLRRKSSQVLKKKPSWVLGEGEDALIVTEELVETDPSDEESPLFETENWKTWKPNLPLPRSSNEAEKLMVESSEEIQFTDTKTVGCNRNSNNKAEHKIPDLITFDDTVISHIETENDIKENIQQLKVLCEKNHNFSHEDAILPQITEFSLFDELSSVMTNKKSIETFLNHSSPNNEPFETGDIKAAEKADTTEVETDLLKELAGYTLRNPEIKNDSSSAESSDAYIDALLKQSVEEFLPETEDSLVRKELAEYKFPVEQEPFKFQSESDKFIENLIAETVEELVPKSPITEAKMYNSCDSEVNIPNVQDDASSIMNLPAAAKSSAKEESKLEVFKDMSLFKFPQEDSTSAEFLTGFKFPSFTVDKFDTNDLYEKEKALEKTDSSKFSQSTSKVSNTETFNNDKYIDNLLNDSLLEFSEKLESTKTTEESSNSVTAQPVTPSTVPDGLESEKLADGLSFTAEVVNYHFFVKEVVSESLSVALNAIEVTGDAVQMKNDTIEGAKLIIEKEALMENGFSNNSHLNNTLSHSRSTSLPVSIENSVKITEPTQKVQPKKSFLSNLFSFMKEKPTEKVAIKPTEEKVAIEPMEEKADSSPSNLVKSSKVHLESEAQDLPKVKSLEKFNLLPLEVKQEYEEPTIKSHTFENDDKECEDAAIKPLSIIQDMEGTDTNSEIAGKDEEESLVEPSKIYQYVNEGADSKNEINGVDHKVDKLEEDSINRKEYTSECKEDIVNLNKNATECEELIVEVNEIAPECKEDIVEVDEVAPECKEGIVEVGEIALECKEDIVQVDETVSECKEDVLEQEKKISECKEDCHVVNDVVGISDKSENSNSIYIVKTLTDVKTSNVAASDFLQLNTFLKSLVGPTLLTDVENVTIEESILPDCMSTEVQTIEESSNTLELTTQVALLSSDESNPDSILATSQLKTLIGAEDVKIRDEESLSSSNAAALKTREIESNSERGNVDNGRISERLLKLFHQTNSDMESPSRDFSVNLESPNNSNVSSVSGIVEEEQNLVVTAEHNNENLSTAVTDYVDSVESSVKDVSVFKEAAMKLPNKATDVIDKVPDDSAIFANVIEEIEGVSILNEEIASDVVSIENAIEHFSALPVEKDSINSQNTESAKNLSDIADLNVAENAQNALPEVTEDVSNSSKKPLETTKKEKKETKVGFLSERLSRLFNLTKADDPVELTPLNYTDEKAKLSNSKESKLSKNSKEQPLHTPLSLEIPIANKPNASPIKAEESPIRPNVKSDDNRDAIDVDKNHMQTVEDVTTLDSKSLMVSEKCSTKDDAVAEKTVDVNPLAFDDKDEDAAVEQAYEMQVNTPIISKDDDAAVEQAYEMQVNTPIISKDDTSLLAFDNTAEWAKEPFTIEKCVRTINEVSGEDESQHMDDSGRQAEANDLNDIQPTSLQEEVLFTALDTSAADEMPLALEVQIFPDSNTNTPEIMTNKSLYVAEASFSKDNLIASVANNDFIVTSEMNYLADIFSYINDKSDTKPVPKQEVLSQLPTEPPQHTNSLELGEKPAIIEKDTLDEEQIMILPASDTDEKKSTVSELEAEFIKGILVEIIDKMNYLGREEKGEDQKSNTTDEDVHNLMRDIVFEVVDNVEIVSGKGKDFDAKITRFDSGLLTEAEVDCYDVQLSRDISTDREVDQSHKEVEKELCEADIERDAAFVLAEENPDALSRNSQFNIEKNEVDTVVNAIVDTILKEALQEIKEGNQPKVTRSVEIKQTFQEISMSEVKKIMSDLSALSLPELITK
ncbi:hypothetical protein HK099_007058, partial [Clydaea vesicula]